MLEENREKMKLNDPGRQTLDKADAPSGAEARRVIFGPSPEGLTEGAKTSSPAA